MTRTFLVDTSDPAELNEYHPEGLDREFYLLTSGDRHYRFRGVYFNDLSWVEFAELHGPNRMQGAVREGALHIAFVWNDNVRMIDTRFSGERMIIGLGGSPWEGVSFHPARCYNMVLDWEQVRIGVSPEAQSYLDRITSTPWGRTSLVAEPTQMGNALCHAMSNCLEMFSGVAPEMSTGQARDFWLSDLTVLSGAVVEEQANIQTPESIQERSRRAALAREVENLLWRLPTWELTVSVTSVDQVAARFHVSRRTLQLALYEFFGVGFVALSRSIRMHRVRKTIQDNRDTRSIASLAQEYGFTHLGRFSVQYRQIFGLTPTASRKN